jgi:apolipoprotein N-acyltransferase
MVNVPAAHSWTAYQVLGDWFAWVAISLTAFAIVHIVRLRGRAQS